MSAEMVCGTTAQNESHQFRLIEFGMRNFGPANTEWQNHLADQLHSFHRFSVTISFVRFAPRTNFAFLFLVFIEASAPEWASNQSEIIGLIKSATLHNGRRFMLAS